MKTTQLTYGDPMRIIAILAVLLIHAADPPVFQYESTPKTTWWVCNTIKCVFLWAVPVFVMLSGALLLNPSRKETATTFYRKRMRRIAIPLIFWSIFYLMWFKYYRGRDLDLAYAAKRILTGTPYMHLYFMYILAGLYAFTPAVHYAVQTATSRQLTAVSIGCLVAATMSTLIRSASGGTSHANFTAFSIFVPYLGYYLMGYAIRDTILKPKHLTLVTGAWIISTTVNTLSSGYLAATVGRPKALMFYEYLSPICIIQSITAYLLIAHFCRRIKPSRFLASLASLTFGLYLIHPSIMDILYNHGFTGGRPQYWIDLPIRFTTALAVGTALAAIFQRVPLLRRTVG